MCIYLFVQTEKTYMTCNADSDLVFTNIKNDKSSPTYNQAENLLYKDINKSYESLMTGAHRKKQVRHLFKICNFRLQ